jgi:hypothetical protein
LGIALIWWTAITGAFRNNISSYFCTEDNKIEGFSPGINDIVLDSLIQLNE